MYFFIHFLFNVGGVTCLIPLTGVPLLMISSGGSSTMAVMIAIVLMLFYFMSIYCVTPIERMNKGLGDWLSFRVPFAVKGDLKDEVLELKEKIESLINISKQTKS